MFEAAGDEAKSQGWTALILDTNGNGKRDDYVEPNQPVDPTRDTRIAAAFYGVAPSPIDGTVWGSVLGFPGAIVRLNPGTNPPATALAEIYEPPTPGYSPRGMDIDRNGVVWAPLASGHLASFDRRKCKGPLNGPTATGQHCPEGWTLYPFPGPQLANMTAGPPAPLRRGTDLGLRRSRGCRHRPAPSSTSRRRDGPRRHIYGQPLLMRIHQEASCHARAAPARTSGMFTAASVESSTRPASRRRGRRTAGLRQTP